MKATAKIAVFDTTLRDGEQAAGTRLGSRDKIRLARQLARLKVDIIEAGFPASSPDDFDAVRKIAQEIKGPTICALSRAVADDIESCGNALAKAARPRIHTGLAFPTFTSWASSATSAMARRSRVSGQSWWRWPWMR
jgi:2-isopropylmalate synthase